MEIQKKVERWSYPFKTKGEGGAASTEVIDPQVYYEALAKAGSGYYPISSNGLWHGGVHFDQNTATMLDQSSVRCIADGVVVAYRIDETYKKLTYTGSGTPKEVTYSTGFVLVRHRLELPPAPTPATTPPATESELTFYSLYMHLMDCAGYEADPALPRPAFWTGGSTTVKSDVTDEILGLRVRSAPKGHPGYGNILAVLPRGTSVETEAGEGNWLKVTGTTPNIAGVVGGYVFKTEMNLQSGSTYTIAELAKDPMIPEQTGLNIRKGANANSPVMAVLPKGAQVRIAPTATASQYHKLLEIIGGEATPALTTEQLAADGYVWKASLDEVKAPQQTNAVVLVDPPLPILAGELIGHLGKYQAASQDQAHDLLHLEVFSCDNVETFVTQSRARARQLKPEQKTLLKIPSGTKVISKDGATRANPPLISAPGTPTTYDMIFPLAVLNALPEDRKITLTTTVGSSTTTERWWKLDNLPGEDGNPFSGWVREDELLTPRLHPWDWEGFDFIKETSTLGDQYVCKLSADGVLDDGETTNYAAQINGGDGGSVKTRLYQIIDVDRNEKLTPTEIKNALAKPWHAQSISRLIAQYESEWYADEGLSKWEALNGYMTKESEKDWTQEKTRIRDLLWWAELEVTPGLASGGTASHFHTMGLLSSWLSPGRCYCYEQGIAEAPCQQGLLDITKEHFELLAGELGIEREVLRAIAVAETGDKTPFKEYVAGQRHALILYERHYMRRLLLARGKPASEVDALSEAEPKIVHTFQSGYSYGTQDEQYERLIRAREVNEDAANMSCSWGKFQVMGEYYRHLYKSPSELVEAQNKCALQHLQYFKVFLTKEKNLTTPMRNKNWLLIAQKYNGASQVGYDQKIQDAYNALKTNW